MKQKITTELEALEVIAAVCDYLELHSKEDAPITDGTIRSTSTASLARQMCYDILDAGNAKGHGGCQLCMS